MEVLLAFVLAAFFAANIGASGTAAAMGEPYGGGAIRSRRVALCLVAVCSFAGAVLGGGEVVKTISRGIVPPDAVDPGVVLVILGAACTTLFVANLLGIPLSTSEVTVGAVAGAGLALRALYTERVLWLVLWWVVVPLVCLVTVLTLRALYMRPVEGWLDRHPGAGRARWILAALLVASGCYQAFSAGMNNVGNAVGPLVGAGYIASGTALWLGGGFLALGALVMGGRPLETNGKKITRLTLTDGVLVSAVGATLVVLASLRGIPVPLTQITTVGILGVAVARSGRGALRTRTVGRIIRVWVISPVASLAMAFAGTLALKGWAGGAPAALGAVPRIAVLLFLGGLAAALALLWRRRAPAPDPDPGYPGYSPAVGPVGPVGAPRVPRGPPARRQEAS